MSSIRALFGLYRAPLADFKHQTRQWLDAESSDLRDLDEDAIRQRRKNTILVVSFGVWDIWNLVGTSYEKAAASADRSIEVLIEQLDLLSEGWDPNDFKVILTLPPDVTFFPAFKSTAKNHLDQLKDTVKIVQHWNDRLRDAVERWHLGTIHLFDTNAFLTDVIRDRQLFAEGVEEEEAGLWENVNDPCVTTRSQWAVVTDEQQCENPEKYLFW